MNTLKEKSSLWQSLWAQMGEPEKQNWIQKFNIEFTHNSTSIEGNTCTLIQTKLILEDKLAPAGKKLAEIDEIRCHSDAFLLTLSALEDNRALNEELIKDIHAKVMPLYGGSYRNVPVYITGASFAPPRYEKVREQMSFFAHDIQQRIFSDDIDFAAWVHAEFVRIHPFCDGNGRTARLIMNYTLMQNGYPPVIIKNQNKENYYQSLDYYGKNKDISLFRQLLHREIETELNQFLSLHHSPEPKPLFQP